MIGLQGKRIWAVCAVAILAGLWAPMAGGEAIFGTFTGYVTGGYDFYEEYGNKIEQYYDNAFLAALGQQLGVHVYAPADGTEATFTFVNWPATYSGAIPAVITEIWWESVVPPLVDYDTADLPDNWHEAAFQQRVDHVLAGGGGGIGNRKRYTGISGIYPPVFRREVGDKGRSQCAAAGHVRGCGGCPPPAGQPSRGITVVEK